VDVSEPEKLERGMFRDPARMLEQPTIEQDNDLETPFAISAPVSIPQYLQDLIQYQSTDPESEEIEQVESDVKVNVDEVTEENPQSRFRILDVAIKKPGICALCMSSGGDGRQFVDFGKSVEWYGVVYFCTFCIGEAAKLLGLAPQTNIDQIIAAHNEMVEKYNELLSSSVEMENATRLLLRNCHCEPVVSGEPFTIVDVEVVEAGESTDSDSDEPGSVEGSDSVSEFASYDELSSQSKPRTRRTSKSTK
jgi:hypothetical protein